MYRVVPAFCLRRTPFIAPKPALIFDPDKVKVNGRRFYSADRRPSFFGNIIKNLKDEYEKSSEMKDTLQKFRADAQKLEESDALKEARRKFKVIEKETEKGSNVFKDHVSGIAEKVKGTIDEVTKAEGVKKATQMGQNFGQNVAEAAENLGKSNAFKEVGKTAATIKEEIEGHSLGGQVYRPPKVLRKRKESKLDSEGNPVTNEQVIEANEDALGVELHKDSKFFQSWQDFKNNNPVMNKFVDYRVKYEESDNPVVRGARIVTDKVQDIFGGIFSKTELSQVLTEIIKMDPNFCKEQFLKDCERDIIPNVLEAMIRGDLDVLQDWCYEAPFNILATPIRQAKEMGYAFDSRVLDIDLVDLAMGKMMEQGPVLVITFLSQQIMCVRNAKGEVVEGDPDKVMRVNYVWVLCRDQAELDPRAAWRLLELSAQSTEQFI